MPRRGFVPVAVIVALALVAIFGGTAAVAWRTPFLDSYLPAPAREFLGRGGAVPSSERSSETPSEAPSSTPSSEDLTKDWKTYTNASVGYALRYPKDWFIEEGTYQGFPSSVIKNSGEGSPVLGIYQNFQGGFENVGRTETKKFKSADGSEVSASIMYREGDENEVTVLVAPYNPNIDLTFIYTFNLTIEPNGLEILSLILSTFSFL